MGIFEDLLIGAAVAGVAYAFVEHERKVPGYSTHKNVLWGKTMGHHASASIEEAKKTCDKNAKCSGYYQYSVKKRAPSLQMKTYTYAGWTTGSGLEYAPKVVFGSFDATFYAKSQ